MPRLVGTGIPLTTSILYTLGLVEALCLVAHPYLATSQGAQLLLRTSLRTEMAGHYDHANGPYTATAGERPSKSDRVSQIAPAW